MSARTLMVQGCTSDAGKSTLVAALCRWLARRGAHVAPFKPQNMALNSAVAANGRDGFGEIGRAQAVQAAACRIAPTTDMNPVLLKPTTDVGAQVIIQGHAIGNMAALDYHAYKSTARAAVLESFDRLRATYEHVIVEGAGSPAEINLRKGDIANMGFAEAVDCPVILVADIDRGGVFAHLVGTLALLSESEQARVKGFVINRFRGDLALLKPGLDWLEARTGKPVLGVLPYLHGLALEAEDAIARDDDKTSSFPRKRESTCPTDPSSSLKWIPACAGMTASGRAGHPLRIIAPVLPRISNHTDFDALRSHPQVDFRFIGPDEPIQGADLIVLPGSKAVRADLAFLRAQGWDTAIARHLRYGGKVIGICGGFQMLGRDIADPLGLEGEPGSAAGLGYLDMHTTLAAEKQLRQVEGRLTLGDAPVHGYEIHAGISEGPALKRPAIHVARMQAAGRNPGPIAEHASPPDSAARHPGDRPDGAISADDQILGTYLHGLFDSPAACDALLAWAGMHDARAPDIAAQREASLERLSDTVEAHLDTARLLAIMEDA